MYSIRLVTVLITLLIALVIFLRHKTSADGVPRRLQCLLCRKCASVFYDKGALGARCISAPAQVEGLFRAGLDEVTYKELFYVVTCN